MPLNLDYKIPRPDIPSILPNDLCSTTQKSFDHEYVSMMPANPDPFGTHGTQQQQPKLSVIGHPLPRRTAPANSATLQHHRAVRVAALRASGISDPPNDTNTDSTASPRRNSLSESHVTAQSGERNGQTWFDQSNNNPMASFDTQAIDLDPPFFQDKSSGENELYQYAHCPAKLCSAQSSSAGDYRSVIDDLTVEIQNLKDELKRYKQDGPDVLRKDKLFEIKIHGLPKTKRRQLEATLRDFTAGLEGSQDAFPSKRKKFTKRASSSSSSHTRPVDSAYHSMSTGPHSLGAFFVQPSMVSRARASERKVENYLRDIPEVLYPSHVSMTDNEKKRFIVQRLEQLFTVTSKVNQTQRFQTNTISETPSGKLSGTSNATSALAPVISESHNQQWSMIQQPSMLAKMGNTEASARAVMLPRDQQTNGKNVCSRDDRLSSNSTEWDLVESSDNSQSSDSGTNSSPTMLRPSEQRPTRPYPECVGAPSDDMHDFQNLGFLPLGLIPVPVQGVYSEMDGWVYLNLVYNLAQLHTINVTSAFLRSALTQASTKFQLSPDGQKIRWRGVQQRIKFSRDIFDKKYWNDLHIDDAGFAKDDAYKEQKTGRFDNLQSGNLSKQVSKIKPQNSAYLEGFHYKPLFVHQNLPNGQTLIDETLSQSGLVENIIIGDSGWEQSGTGSSSRRRQRHDGAIIYYSGALFCIDLSGDPGNISPTTYRTASGYKTQDSVNQLIHPHPRLFDMDPTIGYLSLSDQVPYLKIDVDSPGNTTDASDDSMSEVDLDMQWSEEQQVSKVATLEPCGLGGVLPDDCFMLVVTTKRSKEEIPVSVASREKSRAEDMTERISDGLTSMSSYRNLSATFSRRTSAVVKIEYVARCIKRLQPVPLPPPASFFPPFGSDSDSSETE